MANNTFYPLLLSHPLHLYCARYDSIKESKRAAAPTIATIAMLRQMTSCRLRQLEATTPFQMNENDSNYIRYLFPDWCAGTDAKSEMRH